MVNKSTIVRMQIISHSLARSYKILSTEGASVPSKTMRGILPPTLLTRTVHIFIETLPYLTPIDTPPCQCGHHEQFTTIRVVPL
jgi:hypothetical protein